MTSDSTTSVAVIANADALPVLAVSVADSESVFKYYEGAKSENTRRAYAASFRLFAAWCVARGAAPLRAGVELVTTYLASMADAGRKFSTVSVALAGIAYTLTEAGHALDTRHPGLRRVLSGIRRTIGAPPKKKTALMGDDLRAALLRCDDTTRGKRDRALLALGWAGAFRRSELVALDVSDIVFSDDGIVATVRRSKTDQAGEGLTKAIPYASNRKACPVRAVKAWLDASGITAGPVFRSINRHGHVAAGPMCDDAVALIVKRHVGESGKDASAFAGHSLRSGFITTAARKGKALDAIMRQSGHKSHAVAMGYIQAASLFDDSAAAVGLL